RSADRHRVEQTAGCFLHRIVADLLLRVAGAEEQQRLGDRVKHHVKQHPDWTKNTAKSETEDHDSAMIDAGIREQPPEATLDQDEWHGNADRKQPEQHEELRWQRRTEAPYGQNVEARQRIEGAIEN